MNGNKAIYALFVILLALTSWTLYTVDQQGKQIAKVESNEDWMKTILTEMSHRLNK